MEEDGSRVILSESYNLYTKWTSAAGFYLAYIKNSSDSEEWSFEITLNEGKLTMGRGRKLLIKTDKGDVFELENDKEIGPSDYDYNVSSSGTDYYVKPSYILSEKQIKELIANYKTNTRHSLGRLVFLQRFSLGIGAVGLAIILLIWLLLPTFGFNEHLQNKIAIFLAFITVTILGGMWWDWKTYLWNKNTLVDEMPVAEVSRRMSTFRYWTHYEVWAVAI